MQNTHNCKNCLNVQDFNLDSFKLQFKKITFNKTTTTFHRFHRLTCTNQRNDVRFSKLNVVVLLQSKGTLKYPDTTVERSIGLLV